MAKTDSTEGFVDPFDSPVGTPAQKSAGKPQRADSTEGFQDPFDEAPLKDFSNIGEFDGEGGTEGQKWRLAAGYLTTPSEKARADIIRKVFPGAVIDTDPNNGKLIATYKGKAGYIDAPGVSLSGILDSIAQVAKYLPSGKLANLGANIASRVGLATVGAAATSVAEDLAAIPQGSEQGVSVEKAAVTGVASGVGQAVGDLAVAPAVGWLSAKGRDLYRQLSGTAGVLNPDGTLNTAGRKLAQSVGLNPDDITPNLAKQLQSSADDAIAAGKEAGPDTGEAAVRLALSRRFNTPLTKGEINQDYAQQSLEENLKRMDVTTKAGKMMRAAEKDAANKLRGLDGDSGFGLLNRELTGARSADISDAGQTVLSATRTSGEAAELAAGTQYETAKQLGASLDANALRSFPRQVESVIRRDLAYDKKLYPKTAEVLNFIKDNAARVSDVDGISLKQLENVTKLINSEYRSAATSETDRAGLNVLRDQLNEMVDAALASGKIKGNQNSVEAWKAGRALHQRFNKLYSFDNRMGRAEQSAGREVENWLNSTNVTGEEVITKALQNKALTERILQIHGIDSPAHAALKQGSLEYVFRPALKNEGVSPRLIVSQYEKYFKGKSSEQMAEIFSASDRRAIREFAALAKTKIPESGVVNSSGSANVLVKAVQQLLDRVGILSAASGNVGTAAAVGAANAATKAVKAGQARTAIQGLTPNLETALPSAVSGGLASEKVE